MWPPRIIANESALEKKLEPGKRGDGLLAGVDEIRVDLRPRPGTAPMPSRPFSDCSVTLMSVGNEVGHQRRNADAEIHVVAVAQLLRGAPAPSARGSANPSSTRRRR